MKINKFSLLLAFLMLFAAGQFTSCKKSNTPVDQIVEIIDQTAKATKEADDLNDLAQLQNIVSQKEIFNIIEANKDYKLTDGDKDKLKKSYSKLIEEVFNKTKDYLPGASKDMFKSQLELTKEGVSNKIEHADTLGDLASIN